MLMDGLFASSSLKGMSDSLLVIVHGGGINGFDTLISRIPSNKNLIVWFNNTGGAALNVMSVAKLVLFFMINPIKCQKNPWPMIY